LGEAVGTQQGPEHQGVNKPDNQSPGGQSSNQPDPEIINSKIGEKKKKGLSSEPKKRANKAGTLP